MANLSFETLSFQEDKDVITVVFLRIFSFDIPREALSAIGKYSISKKSIFFKGTAQEDAELKFNLLLAKGFENLRNKINNKKAVYVHKGSGIPLVGNVAFGIVDRNTSIIEVKPITVCNLKCIYCSVNDDARPVDFVVEKDYIIEELKKILDYKGCENIEIHIGGQAEPVYYADLVLLVRDLAEIEQVARISIDTNGTLLSKKLVDDLVEAGMTQFNVSVNSMEPDLAQKIAGQPYSLNNILEIAKYISKKADLIVAPVWMPGVNDNEIPKLIDFAKSLQGKSQNRVILGIQNFLNYRFGRNPVKQMSWDLFRKKLKELEKSCQTKLLLDFKDDFNIRPTKPLPKPFKKGNRIEADIICPGRLAGEKIAAANNRSITLPNCAKTGRQKIKITRSKHNIYYGICL